MQLAERGTRRLSDQLWLRGDHQAEPERSPDWNSQHRLPNFGGAFGSVCSRDGLRKTSSDMRQSYSLDSLVDYRTAPVPETTRSSIRPIRPSTAGPQNGRQPQPQKREFSALNLEGEIETKVEAFTQRKSGLRKTSNI